MLLPSLVAPSVLAADFARLGEEVDAVLKALRAQGVTVPGILNTNQGS